MATYKQAEDAIKEGSTARRASWPDCKLIRGWRDSDHDYFIHPIPNTEGIIMQECDNPCDCKVGVWIKTKEDVEAEDWVFGKA